MAGAPARYRLSRSALAIKRMSIDATTSDSRGAR
jgi:hypothetical protein